MQASCMRPRAVGRKASLIRMGPSEEQQHNYRCAKEC